MGRSVSSLQNLFKALLSWLVNRRQSGWFSFCWRLRLHLQDGVGAHVADLRVVLLLIQLVYCDLHVLLLRIVRASFLISAVVLIVRIIKQNVLGRWIRMQLHGCWIVELINVIDQSVLPHPEIGDDSGSRAYLCRVHWPAATVSPALVTARASPNDAPIYHNSFRTPEISNAWEYTGNDKG